MFYCLLAVESGKSFDILLIGYSHLLSVMNVVVVVLLLMMSRRTRF